MEEETQTASTETGAAMPPASPQPDVTENVAAPPATTESPTSSPAPSLDLVIDLPVRLTVEIGRSKLLLRDVLALGNGSVLELDRRHDDAADILVNGRLIARGDLTSIDDRLAVRIVELVGSVDGAIS